MSKYWVYIDDKVSGPYTVDQLIRLRGFSRQARVCSQEGNEEGPQKWIGPAEIPELSHIFKAVDETRPVQLPPRQKPKPATPRPFRPRPESTDSQEPQRARTKKRSFPWAALVMTLVVAGVAAGGYYAWRQSMIHARENERLRAQQLVENVMVNTPSGQLPFKHYLLQKNIQPRWEFELQPTGLYNVSVIWFEAAGANVPSSVINAFEVNLDAQTVRPLNSAAQLFADNSAAAHKPAKRRQSPKRRILKRALNDWQSAVQNGDFESVWGTFSDRKVQEMSKGGISHSGYVRLQSLTHKLESGGTVEVLKTKSESADSRLVLLKQSQKGQPDVFIKQYWVLENGAWKLDDEQKKAEAGAAQPASDESKPPVTALPGISH